MTIKINESDIIEIKKFEIECPSCGTYPEWYDKEKIDSCPRCGAKFEIIKNK